MKTTPDKINELYRERNQINDTLLGHYAAYQPETVTRPLEDRRDQINAELRGLEAQIVGKEI